MDKNNELSKNAVGKSEKIQLNASEDLSDAPNEREITTSRKHAAAAVGVIVLFVLAGLFFVDFVGQIAPFTKAKMEAKEAPAEQADEEIQFEEPFYVLLMGTDTRKGTALYTGKQEEHGQVTQHADVITLLRVDPETYTLTYITIPRDTVLSGETIKISAGLDENGDPSAVVAAVETLCNVDIAYWVLTDFGNFEQLSDMIGGYTLDVPQKVSSQNPTSAKDVSVNPGIEVDVDGAEALTLIRAGGDGFENSDAVRQVYTREIEMQITEKALTIAASWNDVSLDFAVKLFQDYTDSNFEKAEVKSIITLFAEHQDELQMYSCTGPYEGDYNADGVWVIPEDAKTWKTLMKVVKAGKDPSSVVAAPELPEVVLEDEESASSMVSASQLTEQTAENKAA